jgi:hypothetical protein
VPTRRPTQSTLDDLIRQLAKFIGVANAVLERYAHTAEEINGIRVQLLALEEILRDYTEESGRRDDRLTKQIERLERLEILDRTGHAHSIDADTIRKSITGEHLNNSLMEELTLIVNNLDYARIKAARYGVNVPTDLFNEIQSYTEQIDRIRNELENNKGQRDK